MTKYISSNSLIDYIEEHRCVAENCSPGVKYLSDLLHSQFCDIVKMVEKHDSVELVRCKYCEYYRESELLAPNKFCYRLIHPTEDRPIGYNFSPDDFCSHGKRR